MKIECTIDQQHRIIKSLAYYGCMFGDDDEIKCTGNCEECLEREIEWEITDD